MFLGPVLNRSREQLGYFWRAIVPIPVAKLVISLKMDHFDAVTCLYAAVVLVFLARYSIGNYNYAATVFSEDATWFGTVNPLPRIRRRFAFDAVLFAIQLFMLTWMSHTVQSPKWFLCGLVGLLLADLLFWVFDPYARPGWFLWLDAVHAATGFENQQVLIVTRNWPLTYPPRIWVINNTCTAAVLLVFDLVIKAAHIDVPEVRAYGVSAICLANSLVDIILTRLHFD